MSHEHHHGPRNYSRAFAIGIILNIGFVIAEVVFGFLSNSLALLADAGHNLSDVMGLLLAWGASVLAQRKSTVRRTYGMRKLTILAALLNSCILLVAVGGILPFGLGGALAGELPATAAESGSRRVFS